MKTKKNKKTLRQYLTGSSVKNYLENPFTEIQENHINVAEAQFKANTNPLNVGLKTAGNLAMNYGISQGGFNTIPGINGSDGEGSGGDFANSLIGMLGNMDFATGGTVPNQNVEVEGDELAETPQGELIKFKGPNHEDGGIDVDLQAGTNIYSKRIKLDGKTMADRKLKREKRKAKIEKLMSEDPLDLLTKNTANRTKENIDKQEQTDMALQETMKAFTDSVNTFQTGGTVPSPDDWLSSFGIPYSHQALMDNNLWDTRYKSEYDNYLKGLTPETMSGQSENPLFDLSNVPMTDHLEGADPMMADQWATDFSGSSIDDPNSYEKNQHSTSPGDEVLYEPAGNAKSALNMPDLTSGDMVGLAGNMVSAFGPLIHTLKSRGTDTPNINHFEHYGEEGLETLDRSKGHIETQKKELLKDLELARNGAITRGRNSARGVNTMRALDLATEQSINNQQTNVYNTFSQQMMQILGQEAQMLNMQDEVVMRGEAGKDLADRQDKDNFDSQMSKSIAQMGYGLQVTGKDLNTIKQRQVMQALVNQLSKYGIQIDSNGNLIQKTTG